MKFTSTYNLIYRVLWFVFIVCLSVEYVWAQVTPIESDKTKEFGKSLENFKINRKNNSQNNKGTEDEEPIRVKTDLVVSDVLAVNEKGEALIGLRQSDFVVTENEAPQEISVFSFGENAAIPRSIVLIIDYSVSQRPYIKDSVEAAKVLIDKIAPQDRMAIVTDDVELLTGFTKDKTFLKKQLDSLYKKATSKKYGKSQQYSSLLAVLNELFDEKELRPIILLQTDGDELSSLRHPMSPDVKGYQPPGIITFGVPQKAYSYEDIYSVVSRSRATIYSIFPGFNLIGLPVEEKMEKATIAWKRELQYLNLIRSSPLANPSRENLIRRIDRDLSQQMALLNISKVSGGYIDFLEKPEDADAIYSTIFLTINNRYLIGYYPADQTADGKLRNVKIEVKGHPEYTIVGRKTYFAPEH